MIPDRLTPSQRGVIALIHDMHLGADQAQPPETVEERYDALRDYAFDVERELASVKRREIRAEQLVKIIRDARTRAEQADHLLRTPYSAGREAGLQHSLAENVRRGTEAQEKLESLFVPAFPSHPSAA